jgi:hypothetical protein
VKTANVGSTLSGPVSAKHVVCTCGAIGERTVLDRPQDKGRSRRCRLDRRTGFVAITGADPFGERKWAVSSRPRVWRTWLVGVMSAYVGAVAITIRDCDSRVNPRAMSPFSFDLLGVFDPVIALLGGTGLGAVAYAIMSLMRRTRAVSQADFDRYAWALPPLLALLVVFALLAFTRSVLSPCEAI